MTKLTKTLEENKTDNTPKGPLDYLRTYLDINEIENIDGYVKIGQEITSGKYKKVITKHVRGYIFYYFNEFVNNKISLEDFFLIGDVQSTYNPFEYQIANQSALKSVEEIFADMNKSGVLKYEKTLIIVDKISYDYAKHNFSNLNKLNTELRSLGSMICGLD